MKKILYILPFLFISNFIFSQVNLLDSTCVWSEINYGGYMLTSWSYYYKYTIEKSDTIINQKKYFKLREKGIQYNKTDNEPMPGYSYDTTYTNNIKGFLRNDSNKFYFIDNGNTTEYLLWDFNLKVGDSVKSAYGTLSSPVISMDSVLFNGIYLKRFFSNMYNQYLIEGIGCSSGLFGVFGGSFVETGTALFCFKNKFDIFVVDTLSCSSSLTVGLNSNILINELHLNIFPNPSNGVFTITFQNMPNKNSEIEIFNSLGQRINKDVLNTQTKTIDISSFPKGIYFLKISFGEKYVFKKIITE